MKPHSNKRSPLWDNCWMQARRFIRAINLRVAILPVFTLVMALSRISKPVLDLLIRYASQEDKQKHDRFLMLGAVNPKDRQTMIGF